MAIIKIYEFGSWRYRLPLGPLDCDVVIVLNGSSLSVKDFMNNLHHMISVAACAGCGLSRVAPYRVLRGCIRLCYRGQEYDIVCKATRGSHPPSKTAVFLDELLTDFEKRFGGWVRDAIILFKVICFGTRLLKRHRETRCVRGGSFKSCPLMMWVYCQIDALPNSSIVYSPFEPIAAHGTLAETDGDWPAAWLVSFLVHAFLNFPFDELVVHIENNLSLIHI